MCGWWPRCVKGYRLIGGAIPDLSFGSGDTALTLNDAYTVDGDTWARETAMPSKLAFGGSATLDHKAHIFGGVEFSFGASTIYQTVNRSFHGGAWTAKTAMPTGRDYFASDAATEKAFAIGGHTGGTGLYEIQNGTETTERNENESYDAAANAWTTNTALSATRARLPSSSIDGKLYLAGGLSSGTAVNLHQEYNATSDSYATKTNLPSPLRSESSGGAFQGKAYVVHGVGTGDDPFGVPRLDDVDRYDPGADSWAAAADVGYWAASSTFVGDIKGHAYVTHGVRLRATTMYRFNYRFDGSNWITLLRLSSIPERCGAVGEARAC